MLLPQDVYILLKLCCDNDDWTFRTLSQEIFVSVSQIHLGLKRAETAGLFSSSKRRPNRAALKEFLIHGVRYAYPVEKGPLVIGMPTAYAAPPLSDLIVAATSPPSVWPFAEGKQMGYTVEPLHILAPKAALLDARFYEILALVDALREGRARERKLAEKEIVERLSHG